MAESSHGVILSMSDEEESESFTAIAEVKDITEPTLTSERLDTTSHSTTGTVRTFILGFSESGDITFEVNWLSDNAGHQAIRAYKLAQTQVSWKLVDPDGFGIHFEAYVMDCPVTYPVAGLKSASITLGMTGAYTDVSE